MSDLETPFDGEAAIRAFLAPLGQVAPARRAPARRRRRRARLTLAFAAVAATTIATATAAVVLERPILSHNDGTPLGAGGSLACSGVLGMSGAQAERFFAARRLEVSWRFTRWGGAVAPGTGSAQAIVGGHTSIPGAPPTPSEVWDVELTGDGVIVFLQSPHDPNAPAIARPACP